jgi:hypothetical protein
MLTASRRFGLHKTPVGLTPFVVFCFATFFCTRKNAAHFFIGRKKTSFTIETLCEMPKMILL